MTVKQAALKIGVQPVTIYKWIRLGHISINCGYSGESRINIDISTEEAERMSNRYNGIKDKSP